MKTMNLILGLAGSVLLATGANAGFIVEANGLAAGTNFALGGDTTSVSNSTGSTAIGTTGVQGIFGGNGINSLDAYVYSYNLGTDVDNFNPLFGSFLGEQSGAGDTAGTTPTASGLAGGGSGIYNVYITTPPSTNVSGGPSTITVTNDNADVVSVVDLNSGGTGANLNPGGGHVGGATNAWLLVGTVNLTAGNTYTVTWEPDSNTFVSQRSHGVLWERQVPEPGSLALLGLGGLAILRRRRA